MYKVGAFRPKTHPKPPVDMGTKHTQPLRVIPLGGVGNVTKNMFVYEYGEDILIIDCGVSFPDEGTPGVDLIIPDISYLQDKKQRIKGIVITHAHDDHIGGLPYLWPDLRVPIYSRKLSCGLIKSKFIEHRLPTDQIKPINLSDTLHLGAFKVSFYQVSHSIPDSMGVVLQTPVGTLIHQADFKMDWTPVNGQVTDVGEVARLGEAGVLFMAIDCLRVEKAGYTLSEKTIESTFERVASETAGKILITMTSSNVTRIQQAVNVAARLGRKVSLSGRSMESTFQVAWDLGYLDVPAGLVIPQEEIKRFPDEKLLILIAGSQGQPGSALSRAAISDHKFIHLGSRDTVVFSADPIPGLESAQHSLIDILTKIGCNVYYSALTSELHVSGHAASEELKLMVNLAKPKYILPIGGTFRHMKVFSQLAQNLGYQKDQILLAQEGQIIEIRQGRVSLEKSIKLNNVYVDGLGVGDVGSIILRDRKVMAEEGIVVVVVPIDSSNGQVVGEPDIISRGFIFEKESEGLLEAAVEIIKGSLREHEGTQLNWRFARHHIEENLERFFYEETKRSPLVVPVVVEV